MNINHTKEYSVRIPIEIKAMMFEILKSCSSEIKFAEFSSLFKKKHKRKLNVLFMSNDEMIITQDTIQGGYSKYRNNKMQNISESEKDIVFKNYLAKIDFTCEIGSRSKNIFSCDRNELSKDYLEFKIRLPEVTNVTIEDSKVRRDTEIQSIFDALIWKVDENMPIFIANIYDPSKFWIRVAPIEPFEIHLSEFYNNNKKLSVERSDVCIGLNCVARMSNVYYRGRIVRTDIQNPNTVKIFLYDYGTLVKVPLSDIYHLDKAFYKIPAFAIRAMLRNISSLDHRMWTQNVVDRLIEYTFDKPLIAKIAHIHKKRKILEIHLFDVSCQNGNRVPTINYSLVKDGLAKFNYQPPNNVNDKKEEFKPRKELLYLFPSFETIENGLVPSKVYLTEKLQQCVPLDVIFPDLYEYLGQPE
ncbi:hypothetical protein WA026_014017 [Henosepilachna vigintioctopunctata]|uniref:Tudor domain-containing protein n=1 Tax=Henosepilachna vigintioctopunctata TaxID=420089 RepID=A0AAW1U7K0_9CUCU